MATRRNGNDEETRIQVVPLTEAKAARFAELAAALKPEDRPEITGYFEQRKQHAAKILAAAQEDHENLMKVPFPPGQDPITILEINEFGTLLEYVGVQTARHEREQAARVADLELAQLEKTTRAQQKDLLAAFDQLFWDDKNGQRKVSAIREGTGLADMVQDVSSILVLAEPYEDFFKRCPKGEWQILQEWRALAPRLNHLLGQKEMAKEDHAAKEARDNAFSLMTYRERRIRRAGTYYFAGTPRASVYTAYEAPKKNKPKE